MDGMILSQGTTGCAHNSTEISGRKPFCTRRQNILYNGLTDVITPLTWEPRVAFPSQSFQQQQTHDHRWPHRWAVSCSKNDDSRELPPDPVIDIYPNPILRGTDYY